MRHQDVYLEALTDLPGHGKRYGSSYVSATLCHPTTRRHLDSRSDSFPSSGIWSLLKPTVICQYLTCHTCREPRNRAPSLLSLRPLLVLFRKAIVGIIGGIARTARNLQLV